MISAMLIGGFTFAVGPSALALSDQEILQELKTLKDRIEKLEQQVQAKDEQIKILKEQSVRRADVPEMVEEMTEEGGLLEEFKDRVKFSGLFEFGGAYQSVDNVDGTDFTESDLSLTTMMFTAEAEINEWVNVAVDLLFEDPTYTRFADEGGFTVDYAAATIGNQDQFPVYGTLGRLYVPFGAYLTHFPDDPLIDSPLTLALGETNEKAVMMGVDYAGFSFDAFVYRGEFSRVGRDDNIANYGFDANYVIAGERGLELLVGASYINNIADSEGLTGFLLAEDKASPLDPENTLVEWVPGFDAYLHVGYADFFFDAEYMTALDEFAPFEIATVNGEGAQPAVWNFEFGYNWDWGKNLEIALKYEGSDESEAFGFPERRYGIGFNQTVFEGVVASIAYFRDNYHDGDADGRDKRDIVFGQLAVEF
jgi:hypothetical protein